MPFSSSPNDWPFPDLKNPSYKFRIRSTLVIPIVGALSKIFYDFFMRPQTHGIENFMDVYRNQKKTPLVTVSNHDSCFDEPVLWGFLRWSEICSAKRIRWSVAAHDICFTNALYSWFFSCGKSVPVVRGRGVYQRGVDFCLDRLKEGSWVHLFPEGKVNMTKEFLRLKWGVGRMIYESSVTPILVPFYHVGMDSVLPSKWPYIPRLFKKVTIVFGTPIDFREMVSSLRSKEVDDSTARKAITDVIQNELFKLRLTAEELHRKRLTNS